MLFDRIRLRKQASPQKPPSGHIDLRAGASNGMFSVVLDDGSEFPFYHKALWATVASSRSLTDADHGKMLKVTGDNPTITRPAGLRDGFVCRFLAAHANGFTLAAGAGATINTA